MSAPPTEPPVSVAANWTDLKPLEESLHTAANRLNLKKSKQLIITIGGNRKEIKLRLDGTDRGVPKRVSPPATEVKQEKKYAHASTQTEGPLVPGTMLISVMAFAPFELKKGMQIKCIQVGITDPDGEAKTAVATAAT